jgi:hypothetical protein
MFKERFPFSTGFALSMDSCPRFVDTAPLRRCELPHCVSGKVKLMRVQTVKVATHQKSTIARTICAAFAAYSTSERALENCNLLIMIPQIGDFIAIATLAANVSQALNSSRGSEFEYTSLSNTLKSIGQAMVQAEGLCMEWHMCSMDDICKDARRLERLKSIIQDITKERDECKALINGFNQDFKSYARAFDKTCTDKMHQEVKKLTWIAHKQGLATLENRLSEHLQVLQLLLYAFCQ